ncbi:DUF6153 family protein [Streptomyces griseorubiginosus]|uniref:DUF6153 family protein n=1 Tax=Streptomyces griseorubiginosus TaxID=67304 RepID=UPI00076BF6D6|nr:DUF6153 family protein [Streptomyces griseorubiginosus]KUM78606.1 hypothetical protein AQI84_06215 [Streptomyces griseorubiginosus]
MPSPKQLRSRPPLWRALLLLGLLTGLLGMHGLAPGGGLHSHEAMRSTRSAHAATVAADVSLDQACHDGCGSGHLHHADASCASGAVSGGPVLPALAPDPAFTVVGANEPCPDGFASQDGARAPPSLSELQLLRI